jgi:hypothetical protein
MKSAAYLTGQFWSPLLHLGLKKMCSECNCVPNFRKLLSTFMILFGAIFAQPATAEVVADWGTVISPLTTDATFSFEQHDLTTNFTDEYLFSLEGSSGASYTVTFTFDACKNGCGNPDLTYGIYDANGGLVGTTSGGSITLTAGDYVFKVMGTGMGSGNNVDYSGSITFSAASTELVSPVPEPTPIVLTILGLTFILWTTRKRKIHTDNNLMPTDNNLNGAVCAQYCQ